MSDQRRHRKDPERTEPIRNASNFFRSDDSWDESASFEEDDYEREDWEDVVYRSVSTGYEVTDEEEVYDQTTYDQIRYGERTARGINDRGYGFGRMGDDFWEMSERAFRWYTDMWAFWSQLMTGGMMPGFPPRTRWPEPECRPPRPRPRPWRQVAACVEVDAQQAVTVAVDVNLRMPAGVPVIPHVHQLRWQSGPAVLSPIPKPPLEDIRFLPGSSPDAIHVYVCIPQEQQLGLYTGPIFDRRTERRLGMMSVRLQRDVVPAPPSVLDEELGFEPEPHQEDDRD